LLTEPFGRVVCGARRAAEMLAGQDHDLAPEMLAPLLTEFLC
jgi:hypothetical protein